MAGNTMATIEPRLMHLLNVNDSRDHLPSIHSTLGAPKYHQDSRLLLPPLELGAAEHAGIGASNKPLQPQYSLSSQPPPNTASALESSFSSDPGADNASAWSSRSHPVDPTSLHAGRLDDASAAAVASASIIGKRPRVLPHADELIQLPQPLKKQKSSQQVGPRGQVFPPIINGLHEPPPNAAVFPPIASAEFDNEDVLNRAALPGEFSTATATATATVTGGASGGSASGRNGSSGSLLLDGVSPAVAALAATSEGDVPPPRSLRSAESASSLASSTVARKSSRKPLTPGTPQSPDTPETATTPSASLKPSKRASKPRRRWTDEETDQLLIGVSRHGLGKWTAILEDPEFSFCNRTAGDLKDRFRTCCPDELRGNGANTDPPSSSSPDAAVRSSDQTLALRRLRPKASLSLEKILTESDELPPQQGTSGGATAPAAAAAATTADPPKQRKRKVHRKNMEDMVKLGIRGPFKKSHRRERRPFTEQDDREIIEGLQLYGPAWTKIHRDEKFNLTSRQPTDLRDRVRNKYPEIYANIEKGVGVFPDSLCRNVDAASASEISSRPSSVPTVPTSPLEPHTSTRLRSPFPAAAVASGSGASGLGPGPSHHGPSSSAAGPPLPLLPSAVSRDDLGRRPPTAPLPLHGEPLELHDASVYDLGEPNASSFLGSVGEMGISRLLLDDPDMPPYSL